KHFLHVSCDGSLPDEHFQSDGHSSKLHPVLLIQRFQKPRLLHAWCRPSSFPFAPFCVYFFLVITLFYNFYVTILIFIVLLSSSALSTATVSTAATAS